MNVTQPVAARTDVRALAAGLVTVTLWGSAFVAIRDAGGSLSPGSLALARLLVSLVVLGVAAWIWREPLPRARDLVSTAALGVGPRLRDLGVCAAADERRSVGVARLRDPSRRDRARVGTPRRNAAKARCGRRSALPSGVYLARR